jgi:hypothetical protein
MKITIYGWRTSLPETALLGYVPMVGRSDASASNPGKLIFTPLIIFKFDK